MVSRDKSFSKMVAEQRAEELAFWVDLLRRYGTAGPHMHDCSAHTCWRPEHPEGCPACEVGEVDA